MGPYLTFSDRIAMMARMVVPYAILFFLFMLNGIVIPPPLSFLFKAPFFLMAVYYWSIYRPTFMPPLVVFLAGICLDLLQGVPLGCNALLFLLARMVVVDQRRFLVSQMFGTLWLGFSFLNALFLVFEWGLFSLLSFQFSPFPDFMKSLFFGIALFPLVYLVLHATHKILPASSLGGTTL